MLSLVPFFPGVLCEQGRRSSGKTNPFSTVLTNKKKGNKQLFLSTARLTSDNCGRRDVRMKQKFPVNRTA